ncbi:MAG TPA: uridine kinase [Terriglobales bacterium]|jgi:uridine kinase|nr:uridine kinase [Terriglobales bacterium]
MTNSSSTHAHSTPYLIGVAGPSCAGKTELSRHLARALDATLLPLDCYYRDLSDLTMEQRARFNFDEPSALDHDLFVQHLRDLAAGLPIDRPVYDFSTHSRTKEVERIVPGHSSGQLELPASDLESGVPLHREFIVVEGLFVLYWPDVRSVFGTSAFVHLEDEPCLERRIDRDTRERGRTRESVVQQFTETVQPMAKLYVHPTRQHADIVVPGDNDINLSVATVIDHINRHATSAALVAKVDSW